MIGSPASQPATPSCARSRSSSFWRSVLVDRVAVGVELQRQHVDRDVVQRDRDEDLALAWGQVFLDGVHQHRELLAALGLIAGLGRQGVRKPVPCRLLGARRMVVPGVSRDLARDLEDHELVGPGGEPAEPFELVDAGKDLHHRVVGALLSDIVELWAGECCQLTSAAVQFVRRGAPQDVVELGGGVLVARVVGMQLLDPSARRAIAPDRSVGRRVRRGAVDTQDPDRSRVRRSSSKTAARRATNAHDHSPARRLER
jgi:hypothetical protein